MIDVDVVDPIVVVAHVERETVFVDEVDIVDLLVNVLVAGPLLANMSTT